MNRSVLIITPFFAPQNHAAVFRAYKLAKYLPQFGWNPVVLTVDTQYEFNEDPALLHELPGNVEIVRAPYVEPTLRGIRMALGGRDRSFKSLRGIHHNGSGANGTPRTSIAARGYQHAIKNWIQIPDAYWTWAKAAARAGRLMVQDRMIPVVYTSSSPYSSLCVGRALQRSGAKWVADFRDPLGYSQKMANYTPRAHAAQRAIVQEALSSANVVTVLASSYSSIFKDLYGNHRSRPVFIPTGVDEMLLPGPAEAKDHKGCYLIFAGEYLPDYDDTFFQVFSQAMKTPGIEQKSPKLLFVGTLEINRKRVMPLAERFRLENHVEFRDQMPQKEAYKLIRDACAGVLIPGNDSLWWANFAKMTDYIGMRKPVIAVVPDPSEARTALTRSRLGIFLDGSPDQRAKTLTDFLLGKYPMPEPDESECERYTARQQVKSFVEIFESLASQA